jgi:ribonuclease P protein component
MRKSLTRRERLRGAAALKKVFTVPRKITCSGAGLFAAENGLEYNRVVVSTVRGYGGSVERNRARRIGKEVYRCIKSSIKPGFDLAFILFPSGKSGLSATRRRISGDFSYGERSAQFSFLLKKAGILLEM